MMNSTAALAAGLLALSSATLPAQTTPRRLITLDDLHAVKDVESPELSPDGKWVAYTVSRADLKADGHDTDLWMVAWDGRRTVRLTNSPADESTPRWRPDGHMLAFLSSRQNEDEAAQVWLINPDGGEAERITDIKSGVDDLAWSPDGKKLALVVSDPDSVEEGGSDSTWKKTKRPIVIDRYWFMEDYTGFLGRIRKHLYLFDVESRKLEKLTSDPRYSEEGPVWSPDGKRIAFASKRTGDPDRNDDWNVFIMDAVAGAPATQLTTFEGPDNGPDFDSPLAFSPDGRQIAYLQGGLPKLIYYAVTKLAVIPVEGGTPTVLTATLDRDASNPAWSPDGKRIRFLVVDDGTRQVAEVAATGGPVTRIIGGRRTITALAHGSDHWAVISGTTDRPEELYALDGDSLRALSHQNDAWLDSVQVARTQEISFRSKDGTEIHGYAVLPPDTTKQKPWPAILRIHGGPVSQLENSFSLDWQIMAAHGYLVLAANPRGSSGRGEKFATGIYADWGNKDVQDVLGAVDWAAKTGLADTSRLGVGGWSYGSILTNYVIASDHRFKAATSGAGISDILAGYGTDMYIREYEYELGRPWTNAQTWLKLSYPFLHADRITTPTLFMGGEKDMNVPVRNAMQMYQALSSLGIKTELVVYPGQWHGIGKPSYATDRLRRYLKWYDRFLLGVQ
jgi:dipeptidyl aminopeptidase/acylaminoacyl peptidase